jgi:four helix bundle protein
VTTFRSFEDIQAWQLARALTKDVYTLSGQGELGRDYGLRDQMRRASVSIMANIAEGFERNSNREFIQYLSIAKGSAGEVRSQLYVAHDLGYISKADCDRLQDTCKHIGSLLHRLIEHLRASDLAGPKYKDV